MAIIIALALSACGGSGGGPTPDPKGALEITVSGLSGVDADVTVTGPDSYNASVTKTTELTGLVPGAYEITAQPVAGHAVVGTMPIILTVEAEKTAKTTVTYEFVGVNVSLSAPHIVSLSEAAVVMVNVERFGSFTGEIRLSPTIPGTFDCFVLGSGCMAEQVVPATEDAISYSFIDDGTTPIGTYEFRIDTEHELDGKTIAQEVVFDIDVAPVVTTANDATPANPGMLRFLVADARTEDETITFLPSVFSDATEIILTDEITIAQPLTIDGPLDENDDPLVAIDGNDAVNVLFITADATIQNLGIQHGVRDLGAGVFVGPAADVTLENTRIIKNTASESGGGVHNTGTVRIVRSVVTGNVAANLSMPQGEGGGVYSLGNLIITESDIVNNTARENGGGIAMMPDGALEITGALIADNTALSQSGGGLYIGTATGSSPITVTIDTTFIEQNTAPTGGGIMSFGDVIIETSEITYNQADSGNGGGISNHYKMKITDSLVASNNAANGGGLFNDGYAEISQSTFNKNGASGDGGGIYNGVIDSDRHPDGFAKYATIGTSIIRDNYTDGSGGGIYSVRRLDLVHVQIDENHAGVDGGGIYTVSVPHTAATNNNGGQFTFAASTVFNNVAYGRGGGIYAGTGDSGDSQAIPDGQFVMRNALVYDNIASDEGGGIYLSGANAVDAAIFFTTIMDNKSEHGGAGLHLVDRGDSTQDIGLRYRGNLFLDNVANTATVDIHNTNSTPMHSEGYNSVTGIGDVGHSTGGTDIINDRAGVAPEPYGRNGGTAAGVERHSVGSIKITPDSAVAKVVPILECKNEAGDKLSGDITSYPRTFGDPANCTIGSFEARD